VPAAWPRAALLVYVGLLCGFAYAGRHRGAAAPTAGWNPLHAAWLADWLGRLAVRGLVETARFLPLGLLAALATAPAATRLGRFARGGLALVLSLALAAVVCGVGAGRLPLAGWRLTLPAAGCLAGVWIALAWDRGRPARRWLLVELIVLLLVLTAAAGWLWSRAVSDQPLPFAPTRVTPADKRQLFNLLKRSRGRAQNDLERVQLTSADVNRLVAWWLGLDRPDRKAQTQLGQGSITAQATLGARGPGGRRAYVNLRGAAELAVVRGHLLLEIKQLQVGLVRVPGPILNVAARIIVSAVEDDPNIREVLACVDSLDVRGGNLEVVGNTATFRTHVLPLLLAKKAITPAVTAATRAQIDHLTALENRLPRGDKDARFLAILKAAFANARARSGAGDPIVENRAAILALAIVSGDRRIERLVGPATDPPAAAKARRRLARVSLYGRIDWARHFVVAGALTLLLDEVAIEALGVFKETLDSTGGGSGFSFADLMADRAGRLFALTATRNAESARAMQAWMTGPVRVADFFPPAAGLPEGLTAAQLLARYGGVGGPGYRQVLEEIDRRLRACALLQPDGAGRVEQ